MLEYRITERSADRRTKRWYPHGYKGESKAVALADLAAKQNYYGRVGREFRLECRYISEWEPVHD